MNRALALSLLRSAAHMPDGIDRRFAVYLPDRTKDYRDTVLAFFLQISLAQLDQIHSARRAAYCGKLCEELRTEATAQVAQRDPEELLATVSDAVGRATRYGIVGGDGIRRFVKLAVLVDPRFDELPAVQSFLGLADLDPDLKIKLLSDLAAVQLRNKAS